jgi:uncharacterized protein with ParB-like and HNH nuclease domain
MAHTLSENTKATVEKGGPHSVDGKGRTIRELLSGKRYSIDYYQREYKWELKQVRELIDDLTTKFLESYDPRHERSAVESYGHYFLGSIIISDKNGQKFLIDGQQRLTSLTLLLIYLYHHIADPDDKRQIADLVFSQRYGKKSFNLDVPERTACMEALLNAKPFDESGQLESIVNILNRYHDIGDQFAQLPEELSGKALPHFMDWLIENVHFVEITAYSDEDAYTIFETMNDRGLSLTPTDMLKGYLLANITDHDHRNRALREWKKWVRKLQELGKEEDADGIKSWLRSQYAESIRERKRGAVPRDFDLIGTEFHRWVRDHKNELSLRGSVDFARFIEENFTFYARWYHRIREAAETLTPDLECVFYNAQNNFTLQYTVLLAPLHIEDSDKDILRKLRITAAYLDTLIAKRIWNFRAIDYSTMQYAMFLLMRDIRGKRVSKIAEILTKRLEEEKENFSSNPRFRLHGMNGRQIHQILARMTDYVETQSGMPSRYVEYIRRGGNKGYEVEHIWADHPEWHTDEFSHPSDFEEYRNRIGGLLLLPKSFNASYRDLPYKKKLQHYNSQNLLARSLHEKAYEHNPGFVRFIRRNGLSFRPHAQFKKTDLDARQELYHKLAEEVWSVERLKNEAEA